MSIATGAALFFLAAWTQVAAANEAALPRSPAQLFGPLYEQVESARLYPDSKSFADAVPLRPPQSILADYEARKPSTPAELATFVAANFTLPPKVAAGEPQPVPPAASLEAHIKALWPLLSRPPLQAAPFSSQLSLSHPYVVPGGRFREIYYWDSYFTLLGLLQDGESAMARDLVANFTDLIERYGHVPNGARTYYLSRSQLPVFYLMVGLVPGDTPTARAQQLQALRTEYAFWMRGERELAPGEAREHVVRMPDGAVLNRYWDALDTPRDESYFEDAALAARSARPSSELYRDLRSAAESGWDFSSRWLRDPQDLASIETTAIVPVDLNSLLYGLER
ncbi:MAG: trehalase, partial [Proteobacteria bacterium]|nr:trehalase [Pseudomonadota bacterium]